MEIAIAELIVNFLIFLTWLISKFPLHHKIERKKYLKSNKLSPDQLTFWDDFNIVVYNAIVTKIETRGFIWNILFCIVGIASSDDLFIFALQLLVIINLSRTLQNIVKAVQMRWKILLATFMFVLIILYIFTNVAFFFLSNDYVTLINEPNLKASLSGSGYSIKGVKILY